MFRSFQGWSRALSSSHKASLALRYFLSSFLFSSLNGAFDLGIGAGLGGPKSSLIVMIISVAGSYLGYHECQICANNASDFRWVEHTLIAVIFKGWLSLGRRVNGYEDISIQSSVYFPWKWSKIENDNNAKTDTVNDFRAPKLTMSARLMFWWEKISRFKYAKPLSCCTHIITTAPPRLHLNLPSGFGICCDQNAQLDASGDGADARVKLLVFSGDTM